MQCEHWLSLNLGISHHSNSVLGRHWTIGTSGLDVITPTLDRNPTNNARIGGKGSGRVWKVPCFCRSRRCGFSPLPGLGLVQTRLILRLHWLEALGHLNAHWLDNLVPVNSVLTAYWSRVWKLQFKILAQSSKWKGAKNGIFTIENVG